MTDYPPKKNNWKRLGILYDDKQRYSPSNNLAIERFCDEALRHKVDPFIIGYGTFSSIYNIDYLFIRDTTKLDDYTFNYSVYAHYYHIPVLDQPTDIQIGCNKIWQSEMLNLYKISHPLTFFVTTISMEKIEKALSYPVVIKTKHDCFSQGVYLVNNKKEFIKKCNELFKTNDTIICQEFIKTEYDWRIGILDKKPIFCCKYYMAQDDWKIIKYNRNGEYIDGKHETISISDIPEGLLKITNECLEFLGNGLYGLDIKEKDGKYYVIEINDNPSIDAGVEDEKEGDNLYKSIIMWFLNHPYNQEKIDRKIQIFYMNNNGVILHDKTSKEPKSKRISNISETL